MIIRDFSKFRCKAVEQNKEITILFNKTLPRDIHCILSVTLDKRIPWGDMDCEKEMIMVRELEICVLSTT